MNPVRNFFDVIFQFFKNDPNVKIWMSGGVLRPKNVVFRRKMKFWKIPPPAGRAGPGLGPVPPVGLREFRGRGQAGEAKKSGKNGKNPAKIEKFSNFKSDPNVKIWVSGSEILPKNVIFRRKMKCWKCPPPAGRPGPSLGPVPQWDLAIFETGEAKKSKKVKKSAKIEKILNFQKWSKCQKLGVWWWVSTEKRDF